MTNISESDKIEAIYRTQMEQAFCLVYTNDTRSMDESFRLYQLLTKTHENNAVCRFRLGQALRRRNLYEQARDKLSEAADILERDQDPRVEKRHWIRGAVFCELANAEWELFGEATNPQEKRRAIRSAVSASKRGVEKYMTTTVDVEKDMKLGAINNLLYFACEERSRYGDGLSDDEMKELLDELRIEDVKALIPTNKVDRVLDTIQKINLFLGRKEKAGEIAGVIIDVIQSKVKRRTKSDKEPDLETLKLHLSEDQFDTYWFALNTKAGIAPYYPVT